jgi:hypothetical protein
VTCYIPSADGKYLACGARHGDGLRVLEAATGQEIFSVATATRPGAPAFGQPEVAAFSDDGSVFAVLSTANIGGKEEFVVSLWEVATGRELSRLKATPGGAHVLAVSPDGRLAALAASTLGQGDGPAQASIIRLWETATGKEVRSFSGPGASVQALAFSPDGGTLAVAAKEARVRVWDVASGREIGAMEGEAGPVSGLAFSPDGRTLAGGFGAGRRGVAEEGRVVVWEVASREIRAAFTGHRGGITALAYAPDGRTLVTGGADTTVLVWDLDDGDVERARKAELSAKDLEDLWGELAVPDAARAHRAQLRLAAAPGPAAALIRKRLPPAVGKPVDTGKVERLVAELDSDSFTTRERAARELEQVGQPAQPALRRALEARPGLEKRRRLERLLEGLSRTRPSAVPVRHTRALEVLERLGTPEAREVLDELARGDPYARLTQEAKASLQRLARRTAPKP